MRIIFPQDPSVSFADSSPFRGAKGTGNADCHTNAAALVRNDRKYSQLYKDFPKNRH